jgi:hypothetical protein
MFLREAHEAILDELESDPNTYNEDEVVNDVDANTLERTHCQILSSTSLLQ